MAASVSRAKGRSAARVRRHTRLRKKIVGTEVRPRLVVNRSSRHVFVQVVDDSKGLTLASASTMEADLRSFDGDKTAKAFAAKLDLHSVGDLLHHYPFRYFEPGQLTALDALPLGDHVTVMARVLSSQVSTTRNGKQLGKVVVTDGPYTETKETLGGILLLEARDLDHAIALMSKHPGVRMGPFEIRPANEAINRLN